MIIVNMQMIAIREGVSVKNYHGGVFQVSRLT
jgi:hypothetical protein